MTHELGCSYGRGGLCTCKSVYPPTEMASLREIKQRLAAIQLKLDNYTECILTPMLASLENRLMEAQNTWATQIGFLERVEQGQDKLLQSHAALAKELKEFREASAYNGRKGLALVCAKLDCIQGALLHQQFKSGKPKAKRRAKK